MLFVYPAILLGLVKYVALGNITELKTGGRQGFVASPYEFEKSYSEVYNRNPSFYKNKFYKD